MATDTLSTLFAALGRTVSVSLISAAAASRCSMKTTTSRSSITAKSTTTATFVRIPRKRDTITALIATQKTILHAWEQGANHALSIFTGCSRSPSGIESRRALFCARDRLGIKPFYYFYDGKIFAFASEIKAFLRHPEISAEFNKGSLPEYLTFGYTSGEQTLFNGVRKLMPGYTLRISLDDFSPLIRQYWEMPLDGASQRMSEADCIAELRRRLEETVRLRLMSDVPLGMFLSEKAASIPAPSPPSCAGWSIRRSKPFRSAMPNAATANSNTPAPSRAALARNITRSSSAWTTSLAHCRR